MNKDLVSREIDKALNTAVFDCFKHVPVLTKQYGTEASDRYCELLLTVIVGSLMKTAVDHPEGREHVKTTKELMEVVKSSYSRAKLMIQESVASGFTQAISSGMNIDIGEYYCKIDLIPTKTSTLN